jgi:carbon starvation protein
MNKIASILLWPVIAVVGAFSFAALALGSGENVSAVWLVTAAVCVYFIAYRFYSKFIADKVCSAIIRIVSNPADISIID